ncbi:MAG: hypothetical protein F4201_05400 [Nitrospira sp. SB0677_bin_15]|nr:hypothetical protein [Nitrospira sp. SB0667_bin_9]MYD30948.1 hypothetical protein [Nitrospira sp. SB0661_bin_20]MYG40235.1 hypothetical protein [Nitrospira sp. SB0677_bin_15]MYJ21948.1 hypothetical protein [Nitrospira sp. SB0673_bin_12]
MVSDSAPPVLLRILVSAMLLSFAGCGVMGAPIAPEDIGIEAKIRAQRQAEEKRSTPEEPCRGGPGCPPWLPPLQPVGNQ